MLSRADSNDSILSDGSDLQVIEVDSNQQDSNIEEKELLEQIKNADHLNYQKRAELMKKLQNAERQNSILLELLEKYGINYNYGRMKKIRKVPDNSERLTSSEPCSKSSGSLDVSNNSVNSAPSMSPIIKKSPRKRVTIPIRVFSTESIDIMPQNMQTQEEQRSETGESFLVSFSTDKTSSIMTNSSSSNTKSSSSTNSLTPKSSSSTNSLTPKSSSSTNSLTPKSSSSTNSLTPKSSSSTNSLTPKSSSRKTTQSSLSQNSEKSSNGTFSSQQTSQVSFGNSTFSTPSSSKSSRRLVDTPTQQISEKTDSLSNISTDTITGLSPSIKTSTFSTISEKEKKPNTPSKSSGTTFSFSTKDDSSLSITQTQISPIKHKDTASKEESSDASFLDSSSDSEDDHLDAKKKPVVKAGVECDDSAETESDKEIERITKRAKHILKSKSDSSTDYESEPSWMQSSSSSESEEETETESESSFSSSETETQSESDSDSSSSSLSPKKRKKSHASKKRKTTKKQRKHKHHHICLTPPKTYSMHQTSQQHPEKQSASVPSSPNAVLDDFEAFTMKKMEEMDMIVTRLAKTTVRGSKNRRILERNIQTIQEMIKTFNLPQSERDLILSQIRGTHYNYLQKCSNFGWAAACKMIEHARMQVNEMYKKL